jgi:mannose-6-phosphate isomerase-like protein (cupin superfamily)
MTVISAGTAAGTLYTAVQTEVRAPAGPADLLALAMGYAEQPNDWPFAPRFDPRQRWYGRLAEASDHEVWLLTWLPGQATQLHYHGGSAGAFVVVSGTLTEQTLDGPVGAGRALVETVLPAGARRPFGAHHIHRIVNAGTAPAVSVHVYGPALRAMTRYRLDQGNLQVESVTRAGADW